MVQFNLFLAYQGDLSPRTVAVGCSKQQLLDVLSRHLMLAEVEYFSILPFEHSDVEFKEFTL